MGNGIRSADYVDLNYLKEDDHDAYRHMTEGKPDFFTHTLAINIVC